MRRNTQRMVAAAATVMAVMALMTPPASAAATKRWQGYWGYCLTMTSNSANAQAKTGSCTSGWNIWKNDTNHNKATITNIYTNLCLTIAGGSKTSGAQGVQYHCDKDPSRYWKLVNVSSKKWRFQNLNSGYCLISGPASGSITQQAPCTSPAAVWTEISA
ncbi:RICIN domain-containing protein [Herbidospora daliensis]|uniref:RICIN domain-containing protein n=1 Tax=Herbidospora daliensis TaxID=295585 RepID=UPI0018DCA50F|nr:RICIN domain-containing protein [Herbidospora daliensis]